jgi:hypothetical protein
VSDVLRGGSLQFGRVGGSLFRCRDGEEEGEIEEGRQRGDILTFIDGIPIFICDFNDNFIS